MNDKSRMYHNCFGFCYGLNQFGSSLFYFTVITKTFVNMDSIRKINEAVPVEQTKLWRADFFGFIESKGQELLYYRRVWVSFSEYLADNLLNGNSLDFCNEKGKVETSIQTGSEPHEYLAEKFIDEYPKVKIGDSLFDVSVESSDESSTIFTISNSDKSERIEMKIIDGDENVGKVYTFIEKPEIQEPKQTGR